MPHRFVRPAPRAFEAAITGLTFHAQTELDQRTRNLVVVDIEARIRRYGWQPDITVAVEHATPMPA